MRQARSLLLRWHALTLLLVTLALASSIILPRGFMPERGADGLVRIMLCTGTGPAVMLVPADQISSDYAQVHKNVGSDQQNGDAAHQGVICPYAGALAPLMTPGDLATIFALPPVASVILGRIRLSLTPGRGMAAPPPPSQAPPSSLS